MASVTKTISYDGQTGNETEDGLKAVPHPKPARRQTFFFGVGNGSRAVDESRPEGADPGARAPDGALPVQETDFAELEDGTLVELVEDRATPGSTRLAVWRNRTVTYTDFLECGGRIIEPVRKEPILRYVRLPSGASPYESTRALLSDLEILIARCADLPKRSIAVLANFVLATWFVDRLPVAPYVALVGMPGSGKTTLLQVLSLLCRRSLLTADITAAAFFEACSGFTPTLLIDETGTHHDKRYLYHLLRIGTTPDVLGMRRNDAFCAFGPKVLSCLEPPDDPALNNRCIVITMSESSRSDLVKPSDPEVIDQGVKLQQQLLQFRFEQFKTIRFANVPGSETLRPRVRDLLNCLAAPCASETQWCSYLLSAFKFHEEATREALPPAQNALLIALFRLAHADSADGPVTIAFLTEAVNNTLARTENTLRLQPRKIGAMLTSFGLRDRERTNLGWRLHLTKDDRRQIHRLGKTYGMDGLLQKQYHPTDRQKYDDAVQLASCMNNCPLCKEFGFGVTVKTAH